jgi:hypothetical protein
MEISDRAISAERRIIMYVISFFLLFIGIFGNSEMLVVASGLFAIAAKISELKSKGE